MLSRLLLVIATWTGLAAGALTHAETLITGDKRLQSVNQRITNIDTRELAALLEADPQTVVVDVRTPDELLRLGGMIDTPRIYNVPLGWLEFRIGDHAPSADTPIIVYCGINKRSPLAADRLMKMGYTHVKNYADGFFKWKDAGLPVEAPDEALDSILFARPQKVVDGVWSAIGATEPQTYENSGHNNNLTAIITEDGVVLVNASNNYLLARAWHEELKKITEQPVKYVIFENGQTHAAFGAKYWKEQGATLVAHADAAEELRKYGAEGLDRVRRLQRDKAIGTEVVLPDITFEDRWDLELGGVKIEALHLGPAHSPGDISVWLPQKKVVIAGDIAFHQRLLAVFEHTNAGGWVETWGALEALEPEIVIPGHGKPTTIAEVRQYTHDYLVYLRDEVEKLMDDGGTLEDVRSIDQSAYSHLDTYEQLNALNASIVFRQMEFE